VDGHYGSEIRCGSLHRDEWLKLLDSTNVLFMTPQTLLNMFTQGAASFDQIGLLVRRYAGGVNCVLRLLPTLP